MSSDVKHGPVYESKFVMLAFPTQVYECIQLSFEFESPESNALLLTDCSLGRAIRPFVFFTPSHNPTCFVETMEDPFENNEAAWFIILIRQSETLA